MKKKKESSAHTSTYSFNRIFDTSRWDIAVQLAESLWPTLIKRMEVLI